ncbi:MAG: hypothetical protein Tp176DCM1853251_35 [Prokaryotic dsDNA virus sp.]|nr:MAG: hypothetical protein Tp176DCM1853251_35 [Prokaryotic dsDNA virus sp.]
MTATDPQDPTGAKIMTIDQTNARDEYRRKALADALRAAYCPTVAVAVAQANLDHVAKAICVSQHPNAGETKWQNSAVTRDRFRALARAAVRALADGPQQ